MTRNVTLRMDEDLLAELRHRAVDAHMSLSAWITTTLEAIVPHQKRIDAAKKRAIARMDKGFRMGGRALTRDQLHER